MNSSRKNKGKIFSLKSRKFWALPFLVWLLLTISSLFWNVYSLRQNALTSFRYEAQTLAEVALSTMIWAEQHELVLLPLSEWIPKEPFYAQLPYRDKETICGLRLTQVSPGAIISQQAELAWIHGLTRKSIRVVGFDSLNPVNAPDKWEYETLLKFQNGTSERFSIIGEGEDGMLKYMVPLKLDNAEGSKLIGGLSVRELAETRFSMIESEVNGMIISHTIIFVLVAIAMFFLFSCLRLQGINLDRINEEQKEMISKLAESEFKLEEMSVTDELTGLKNRRGFFMFAAQRLNMAKCMQEKNWLVFIDIDGMKLVNDNFGHTEGDKALIATAKILNQTFRKSDVIARMGGDEFVVLSEADTVSGSNILTRLQKNLDRHNAANNSNYRLSLSAGIVECSSCQTQCSIGELLKKADELMYESKKVKKSLRHSMRNNPAT